MFTNDVAILTHLYGTFGRVLQANVTVDLRRRGFCLPVLDIEDSCWPRTGEAYYD
jgi:hypothetical protein